MSAEHPERRPTIPVTPKSTQPPTSGEGADSALDAMVKKRLVKPPPEVHVGPATPEPGAPAPD